LALGGRPAAIFARRLMLPVSNDTLLRMVRRRARLRAEPLRAIGIDDQAWHKGHRYGSIVCDLQRRRIVTLLADREVATVEAWLRHHPEIMVIARDRGGGYGEAASRALPNAIQVADRWHLIENASAALLDVVRKSMRLIRNAIGATTIDRELLTSADRLQHDGYLRREEANAAIMAMAKDGVSIKQIVRQTGHSRKTVRQVIRGARADVFRSRMNSLGPISFCSTRTGLPAADRPASFGDGQRRGMKALQQPLRQAGAIARIMLVAAAAKRWKVNSVSCRAQSGEVLHAPTGRRIKYGELAAAARMPVPANVVLKRPEDFKLIGTPAKRLDTPAKINGTAVYGIDVRPLGVKIATLAQSPVF
jgi:Transposase